MQQSLLHADGPSEAYQLTVPPKLSSVASAGSTLNESQVSDIHVNRVSNGNRSHGGSNGQAGGSSSSTAPAPGSAARVAAPAEQASLDNRPPPMQPQRSGRFKDLSGAGGDSDSGS